MNFVKGELIGSVEPRIFTPPLRELTPETTVGFDQIEFARDVLRHPADPWQEVALIRGGELQEDGVTPRFRIVIVLAARQNGKTEIPVILTAYWLFVDRWPLILGTSTKLEYAKETWDKSRKLIQRTPGLDDEHPAHWYVRGAMATEMWGNETEPGLDDGSRYRIAASNAEGGRSLTINRLLADELRQHHDYSAWNAMEPACSPWDTQIWALSNAGDDTSVVLNDLVADARLYIETGGAVGDPRVCLLEWSSPEDSDPTDVNALAMANPNLGLRKDPATLLSQARTAVRLGGEALTGFKTEQMCIRVRVLNPAIDPGAWLRCKDVGDLSAARGRVAACLDVAPDERHVTLVVAAMLADGRVRVEVAAAWPSLALALAALPGLIATIRPQKFGWFPTGPAAAAAAQLADLRKQGRRAWPPAGVTVAEIRGDMAAACMGLSAMVDAGTLAHSADPLLDKQVANAEWLKRGDTKVFVRRGDGHVDAVYGMAGAVHLARTLPPPVGKPRLVVVDED